MSLRTLPLLILTAAIVLAAQEAPRWKEFSLGPATVKPGLAENRILSASVQAESITLSRLLAIATGSPSARVQGPDWMESEHWAVVAVPETGLRTRTRKADVAPVDSEFRSLLLGELVSRFRLAYHRETRDQAVLTLRIAHGRKWTPHPSVAKEQSRMQRSGTPLTNVNSSIEAHDVTFENFARWLERQLQQPVLLDDSIPPGGWDFRLKWRTADAASLSLALAEQLGLELAPGRQQVEYLIIDRAERPAQGTKNQ